MFTHQDTDRPKMPPATKMHLPIMPESVLDEMNDENLDNNEQVQSPHSGIVAAARKLILPPG